VFTCLMHIIRRPAFGEAIKQPASSPRNHRASQRSARASVSETRRLRSLLLHRSNNHHRCGDIGIRVRADHHDASPPTSDRGFFGIASKERTKRQYVVTYNPYSNAVLI
jgi:hypothetical protein